MGRIGPLQQRFEVLPVPAWTAADLLDMPADRDVPADRDFPSGVASARDATEVAFEPRTAETGRRRRS